MPYHWQHARFSEQQEAVNVVPVDGSVMGDNQVQLDTAIVTHGPVQYLRCFYTCFSLPASMYVKASAVDAPQALCELI
jgi:hypothetical protein